MKRLLACVILLTVSAPAVRAAEGAASPWCTEGAAAGPSKVLYVLNLPADGDIEDAVDELLQLSGSTDGIDCAVVTGLRAEDDQSKLATSACGPQGRANLAPFDLGILSSVLDKLKRPENGVLTVIVLNGYELTGALSPDALAAVDTFHWLQLAGAAPDVPGVVPLPEGSPVERLDLLRASVTAFSVDMKLRGNEAELYPLDPLVRRVDIPFVGPFALALRLRHSAKKGIYWPEDVSIEDVCLNFPSSARPAAESAAHCRAEGGVVRIVPPYSQDDKNWRGTCHLDWTLQFATQFSFPRGAEANEQYIDGELRMSGAAHVTTPLSFVVKAKDGVGECGKDEDDEVPSRSFDKAEQERTFEWTMTPGQIEAFRRSDARVRVVADDYPLERTLEEFFPELEGLAPEWDPDSGTVVVRMVSGSPEPGEAHATVVISAYAGWLTSGEMDMGMEIKSNTWLFVLLGGLLGFGLLWLVLKLRTPPQLPGLTLVAGDASVTIFSKSSKAAQSTVGVARLYPDGEGNLLVRREAGNSISITPQDGAILQRASGERVEGTEVIATVLPGGKRLRTRQQLLLEDGTPLTLRVGGDRTGGKR